MFSLLAQTALFISTVKIIEGKKLSFYSPLGYTTQHLRTKQKEGTAVTGFENKCTRHILLPVCLFQLNSVSVITS